MSSVGCICNLMNLLKVSSLIPSSWSPCITFPSSLRVSRILFQEDKMLNVYTELLSWHQNKKIFQRLLMWGLFLALKIIFIFSCSQMFKTKSVNNSACLQLISKQNYKRLYNSCSFTFILYDGISLIFSKMWQDSRVKGCSLHCSG